MEWWQTMRGHKAMIRIPRVQTEIAERIKMATKMEIEVGTEHQRWTCLAHLPNLEQEQSSSLSQQSLLTIPLRSLYQRLQNNQGNCQYFCRWQPTQLEMNMSCLQMTSGNQHKRFKNFIQAFNKEYFAHNPLKGQKKAIHDSKLCFDRHNHCKVPKRLFVTNECLGFFPLQATNFSIS